MGQFSMLARPASDSLDATVIRQSGAEFAAYVDSDSAAPLMGGLRAALEAPIHPSQLLNASVALSDVVALLALAMAEDQGRVADFVTGPMSMLAVTAFPEVVGSNGNGGRQAAADAEAMVCRAFGAASIDQIPQPIGGPTLAAIAAYGDAAIMLADGVGLPRQVLSSVIGDAAANKRFVCAFPLL